jgi:hypothetical protein
MYFVRAVLGFAAVPFEVMQEGSGKIKLQRSERRNADGAGKAAHQGLMYCDTIVAQPCENPSVMKEMKSSHESAASQSCSVL